LERGEARGEENRREEEREVGGGGRERWEEVAEGRR
jgi:hypothetical protein